MLANLVNGLCALASGTDIFTTRKKEDTLSGRLSEGRVSFEDALSHIYPQNTSRPQEKERAEAVVIDSVTIYEAYKTYKAQEAVPLAPGSEALSFQEILNQGQINSQESRPQSGVDEYQSQIDTYDNLPAQPCAPSPVETVFAVPAKTFENLNQIQADLAQQILGNYAETVAPVRRDFLANMTNASAEFLAGRNKPAQADCLPTSMSTSMTLLVDRIFSILEPYIHELNQNFRATDLSITFTPPAVVNENVGYDALRRPSVVVSSYRCRISTSRLALVVRGKEDRVDFFLLPVESVMGLSRVEDAHQPLMTFSAYAKGGVIHWEVEEKPLTEERMERFILLIFEHLMDLTREELLRRPAYAGAV